MEKLKLSVVWTQLDWFLGGAGCVIDNPSGQSRYTRLGFLAVKPSSLSVVLLFLVAQGLCIQLLATVFGIGIIDQSLC